MTNWLTGWGFRKSHLITASAGAGTNYQTCIKVYKTTGTDGTETANGILMGKVYVGSNCRDDFGDIRFTDNDGDTLLDCWMETLSSGVYAVFWVEVKDTLESNATIYVYYSKSDATYPYLATDTAQGEATFLFFDHFPNSAIDTNKWEGDTGAAAVSGSIMTHSKVASSYSFIRSKTTYGPLVRYRTYAKRTQIGSQHDIRFGFCNDNDADRVFIWAITGTPWKKFAQGTATNMGQSQDANYRILQVFFISNALCKYQIDNNAIEQLTTGPAVALKVVNEVFAIGATAISDTDWVFISKFVATEPAHSTWGSEEQSAIDHYITVTELLGGLDSYNRSKNINRTVTELLGVLDTYSRIKSYFRTITESLGVLDSKSRVKNIHRIVTELIGLKDSQLFTFLHNVVPIITAGIGKVFGKIEVLTKIKIPISFSRKCNILTFLSDLSSTQLEEILGVKSDYARAIMLNLFQIKMPISCNKVDEIIIKLTSSLIHHKNEKLLQVLINLVTLKEIMEFLNDED